MSFAIRTGVADDPYNFIFIYFDAITSYTEDHRGTVTKHPVDSGGNITDHFINENPTYRFSAVLTGTDISSSAIRLKDAAGNTPINAMDQPTSISIKSSGSKLLQFLPGSVSQFLPTSMPEVVLDMDSIKTDRVYEEATKYFLTELIQGAYYNTTTSDREKRIKLVSLYQFDIYGNVLDIVQNLVMTGLTVNETPESGDALFVDITLEQVEFAKLKRESLPEDVKKELKPKVSTKKAKGKQDSTVKSCNDPNGSGSTSSDTPKTDAPGISGDRAKDIQYGETSSFSKLNPNGLGSYGS